MEKYLPPLSTFDIFCNLVRIPSVPLAMHRQSNPGQFVDESMGEIFQVKKYSSHGRVSVA